MCVVRRAQINLKQQFRIDLGMKLIRMKLGVKFCMWLDIRKYIYLTQSINIGVVRHTWTFQINSQY